MCVCVFNVIFICVYACLCVVCMCLCVRNCVYACVYVMCVWVVDFQLKTLVLSSCCFLFVCLFLFIGLSLQYGRECVGVGLSSGGEDLPMGGVLLAGAGHWNGEKQQPTRRHCGCVTSGACEPLPIITRHVRLNCDLDVE